jgi:hypothetical protein
VHLKTNLKSKVKRRCALELSRDRCASGLAVARRLSAVALKANDEKALQVADRLGRCASEDNIFLGFGMTYEGREFNGHGILWGCGLRLCPSCIAKKRSKSRKRAFEVVDSAKLVVGENWRLITLTFPNLPNVELHTSLRILACAWDYFRKRKIYTENFGLGVKGYEFELGNKYARELEKRDWSLMQDGFHPHIHLLAATKWITANILREEWTECVKLAWSSFGVSRSINTSDGLCITNIKQVGKDVTMDKAVFEVTKYITKSNCWMNLPDSELLGFARACGEGFKGWPRMFEVLGRGNGNHGKSRVKPVKDTFKEDAPLDYAPVLDNKGLSDGKFALNSLYSLSDVTAGDTSRQTDSTAGAILAAASALSLKELARVAPRWVWLHELDRRIAATQWRRKASLASRYPDAKFATLSGRKWRWCGFYMVEID